MTLTDDERATLRGLLAGGRGRVRRIQRMQVLLAADAGTPDAQIAASVGVAPSTVWRIKRRYVEGGLDHALDEQPRPGGARKLSGKDEALLVATACSAPPAGRARWTLQLLADALVRLTDHATLGRETVRRRLAAQAIKPWQRDMWCIPKVTPEFLARMEDVLDLYAAPPDPARPTVSFDESPVGLIAEVCTPVPAAPGRPARHDYEYVRHGAATLFVTLDVHRPWRHVAVHARRTAREFAACMRDLAEVHYPDATCIRVVLDNLSTHTPAALYETFPPQQARQILRRLEFHYVPKHASWLNMVEIEIGVLKRQCLDRRLGDRAALAAEVARCVAQRNEAGARVQWAFTTERAREKLRRLYEQVRPEAAESASAAAA